MHSSTYRTEGAAALELNNYIRSLGYHAQVMSSGDSAGPYIPMHVDAVTVQLGACGYMLLLKREVIPQELIDLLMSWNYNSGFQVHGKQKVNGHHGDRIETIARYMSRAAISVERIKLNFEDNTVTVYEKQNRSSSKKAHYKVFEFMALLAGHLPSPYETIT